VITSALTEALMSVQLRPQDGAAVALAHRYAALADSDPDIVPKVGPQLLQVLVELGMTPKARAGVVRGGQSGDSGARTKLDELRERRGRRVDPS
jgi:hypothetical protein